MILFERVKIEVEVEVNVNHLAEQFAALTDDAQAQFLCMAAAKIKNPVDRANQAFYVGRHLATCECSTQAGRDFVNDIAAAMKEFP